MNLSRKVIFAAFLGAGLAEKTLAKNQRLRIPTNKQPPSKGRKLTNFQCTLFIKATQYEDKHIEESPECQIPGNSLPTPLVNMPTWLSEKFLNEEIDSNVDSLELSEALIYGEGIYIPAGAQASLVKGTDDKRRRRLNKSTYSLMAMRISNSGQNAPPLSNSALADSIFGDNGDVFNLKNGYDECSYGGFIVNPGTGNGVVDVGLTEANDHSTLTNAALTSAGLNNGGAYDFVMSCVPSDTSYGGSTSWVAYAYINHWLSVYRGSWCAYPSSQMHEVGHNINLAHSGENGNEYDDQSCMMGYSYSSDEGPRQCFNGPKFYQLGWLSDRHVTISNGSGWSGNMYGISTYASSSSGDAIVVMISSSPDDIYVSYNKATGISSGTVEGANQVLVHTKSASPSSYGLSFLEGRLNSGGSVTIQGNTITFVSTSSNYAVVQINEVSTPPPTSQPNPNPTPPPTSQPTNPNPTPPPTSQPNPNPTPPPTSQPNPNPTPPPTSQPIAEPTPFPTSQPPSPTDDDDDFDDDNFCVDDPTFKFTKKNGKKKGCSWFGKRKRRCYKKPGALDACPDSCAICNLDDGVICSDSRMNKKACKSATFCSWDKATKSCF